jgi:hypothetical protein
MKNKFLAMTVLLLSGVTYAMEPEGNDSWTAIKTWQDVSPFAGKIVAYTAIRSFLDDTIDRYLLPSSNLSYGYVEGKSSQWVIGGEGYKLHPLLEKEGEQRNIALKDAYIAKRFFDMRKITSQEAEEIRDALTAQEAKFAYVWKDKFDYIWSDTEEELISQLDLIIEK